MPGNANKMLRVLATYFDQRLRGSNDFDQPAVFQHQRITAAQGHRVFQIEQEFQAARAPHRHPPPMTIVEIEHNTISRRFAPAMLSLNARGADHGCAPS